MKKICFVVDRPPIFNGGFSQRIIRETQLVSSIESVEIYFFVLVGIRELVGIRNVKEKLIEKIPGLNESHIHTHLLLSSRLLKDKEMYDKYYSNRLIKYIKKNKIDLMICENLWCAWLGCITNKKLYTPYVIDYHGVVPEEYVYYGICKYNDEFYRYLKRIERESLINAEKIICVSKQFVNYIKSNFPVSSNRIYHVPCCINECVYEFDLIKQKEMRKNLNLEEKIVFIYAGSIVKYQCVEEMIWIFSIIHKLKNNAYFIFLSAYDNFASIEGLFSKYNVPTTSYCIKSVPHQDIDKYYVIADYALIFRENHLLNKVASPTKIAEYLKYGLVMFATDNIGDINEIPTKKFLIDYQDIKDKNEANILKMEIKKLSDNDRIKNFNACQQYLKEEYLWNNYKKVYEEVLKDANN